MGVSDCYCKYLKTSAGVKLDGTTDGIVASFNSETYEILFTYGYSVSATWTGDATGTFKIQASNDARASADVANVTGFVDIVGTETALASGSPIVWNIIDVNYRWFRFVYTRTGGTLDDATVSVTAKG